MLRLRRCFRVCFLLGRFWPGYLVRLLARRCSMRRLSVSRYLMTGAAQVRMAIVAVVMAIQRQP